MIGLPHEVVQLIFSKLQSPVDLLHVAQVSKTFYKLSRANICWQHQKQRVLCEFSCLQPLFDEYADKTRIENGKQIRLRKKPKKETWVCPKGIWYVFARHLMFKNITQVLSRKTSREYMIDALCLAAVKATKQRVIQLENRPHIKLHPMCRFQRCILITGYTYIWIGMSKHDARVSYYDEEQHLRKVEATSFVKAFVEFIKA